MNSSRRTPLDGRAFPPGIRPLPSRRPLLSRDVLDDFKRRRIAAGIARIAHEEGLAGLTVPKITAAAKMSRTTVYHLFANKIECVEYACELGVEELLEPFPRATAGDGDRRSRLRVAAATLSAGVTARPLGAELVLVHSRAIESAGASCREKIVGAVAQAIGGDPLAELTAGAVVSAVSLRLMRGGPAELAGLEDELAGLAGT
jgi:AcrR family transcriptional regulator